MMISLDDPKWRELQGGYRVLYDASVPLRRLEAGEDVWGELWQNLHHQGNLGNASYAALPHLVRIARGLPIRDWKFYSLVSVIEVERHRKSNPPLPAWLANDYIAALRGMLDLALDDLRRTDDRLTIRSILGAIALAKRDLKLGALISGIDECDIDEYLDSCIAWSERYG